jgi:hypothetical protein
MEHDEFPKGPVRGAAAYILAVGRTDQEWTFASCEQISEAGQ